LRYSPAPSPGLLVSRAGSWGEDDERGAASPHPAFRRCLKQVSAWKGLWIPAAARMTDGLSRPHMSMKMTCFHSCGSRLDQCVGVAVFASPIPRLAGVQGRFMWRGNERGAAIPHPAFRRCLKQVSAWKGLWIPAAARMTDGLSRPHMSMKMTCFHSCGSRLDQSVGVAVFARPIRRLAGVQGRVMGRGQREGFGMPTPGVSPLS
jgi:hypothetical protein